MTLPNFLILGAAKTATTSIYRYLKQHPQIFMSGAKEPNFFAFEGEPPNFRGPRDLDEPTIIDIERYRTLFDSVTDELAIGEASVLYLSTPHTPERIHHHIPDAKLMAFVRDPVDRAFSNFLHLRREKREPFQDFEAALQAESERIEQGWKPFWYYKQQGFYYQHLQRYLQYFDRDRLGVWLFEDFQKDPLTVLQQIFQFLEVDDSFMPDISEKVRVTPRQPKNKTLHYLFSQPNPIKDTLKHFLPSQWRKKVREEVKQKNMTVKEKPSSILRKKLIDDYREDILQLQDFLKKDLSTWLKVVN
ncbi:MAG: sulfotransferase [Cyanobacteria bacterium P01_E01_bin.42]